MKNRIFVSGATGFQGAGIAKSLLTRGDEVLTLSPSAKEEITNEDGLKVIPGGFRDKSALVKALIGVEKATFTFPLVFDIKKAKLYTSNFISAAEDAGVSLVIFNSSFDLASSETGLLALDLKLEVARLFEKSNLEVITLVPDIYIDNLAAPWSIPVMLEKGILPYPIESGQKVPWISHSDLAKYVVSALDKPNLAGKVLPIGGNLLSGEEIALTISHQIGKKISFVGLAPDDFQKQLAPAFGELASKEISNLYRYVEKNKAALVAKDFVKTQDLLSVEPQSIQEWVAAIDWNA